MPQTDQTILKTESGKTFQLAQDEARTILRGRRHIRPNAEEDFFVPRIITSRYGRASAPRSLRCS